MGLPVPQVIRIRKDFPTRLPRCVLNKKADLKLMGFSGRPISRLVTVSATVRKIVGRGYIKNSDRKVKRPFFAPSR
jgi:hypothetical protein